MEWINVFGTVFIVIIMIPNIIYALKCKNGFENKWHNKAVEIRQLLSRGKITFYSLIFMEWAMNCKVCVLWALW